METICKMTQEQLKATLKNFLQRYYNTVVDGEDYIYAQGELQIALVAHLDTVESIPPTDIYYDKSKKVMWSPQLLGADDRAGVYLIVQIIEQGYRPSIIFTCDEELGALGAQNLVSEKPKCPLENLHAIIQLDRRGKNDCVFYNCNNASFTQFIESFGFKSAWGSYSDISFLAPAWNIAAVNLSVGYENEHQNIELLHTDWLESTFDRVCGILEFAASGIPKFEYIADRSAIYYNIFPSRGDSTKCAICGSSLNHNNKHHVKDMYGDYYVCTDCLRQCF